MKHMFLSKKALSGDLLLFLFWRLPVALFVAIAMIIFVHMFLITQIDIQETHAQLFVSNLLNSKHGLSYYDTTIDRGYPGVIRLADFEDTAVVEEKLKSSMDYGEQHPLAAQLTLLQTDGEVLGTLSYQKEWYQRWIILARAFFQGPGGATAYAMNKTVLILSSDGNKNSEWNTEPGILQVIVVLPNS